LLTADFNEPSAFTNLQSQKARPCDIVRQRNRMASIGHIAVGMATTRIRRDDAAPRWTSMAWWSMLALLPDIDVIGFALGVPYSAPWGHRGATHSLVFALALASVFGFAALRLRMQPLRTWSMAAIVLVSHGALDTLTDGGLGIFD
jgi:inner membrane protein